MADWNEVAEDHYIALSWSGGLNRDGDGYPLSPPSRDPSMSGGLDQWMARAARQSEYRCKFCRSVIGFLNRKPYNLSDGSAHRCLSERAHDAEQAAQAVPAGFKWVPVEPTEDMLTAAGREDDKAFVDGMPHGATAADVWAVMLASAPAAPAPEAQAARAALAQRQPLTEQQRRSLAGNYFSEQWAIQHAMDMLHDCEQHRGIGATTREQ